MKASVFSLQVSAKRIIKIMKFKKKPIVVECVQYDGNFRSLDIFPFPEVRNFIISYYENGEQYIKIPTLEGEMKLSKGDWLIKGVNGEYYPCKPDIFEKTYENT